MAGEEVNRVGMGVDLYGGPDVLTNLRAIRSEMTAIRDLAGSINIPRNLSGGGTPTSYNPNNQGQLTLFDDIQKGAKQTTAVLNNELTKRENNQKASNNRQKRLQELAQEREAKAFSKPNEKEVELRVAEKERNLQLNQRINNRMLENERERAVGMQKVQQMQRATEQAAIESGKRYAAERRRLAEEMSRIDGIDTFNPTRSRGQFRRNRDNPNRNDEGRDELATKLRAQRIARDRANQLAEEREAQRMTAMRNRWGYFGKDRKITDSVQADRIAARQAEIDRVTGNRNSYFNADAGIQDSIASERRKAAREAAQVIADNKAAAENRKAAIRRAGEIDNRRLEKSAQLSAYRGNNPRLGPGREDYFDVEQQSRVAGRVLQDNIKQRGDLNKIIPKIDPSLEREAKTLYATFGTLAQRTERFTAELRDVNRTRPLKEVVADLKQVEREQELAIQNARQLKSSQLGSQFRAPGSGPPPNNIPNLRNPTGLLNEKGFFTSGDAVGRITRNILLYEAVSRLTYGTVEYIQQSVKAAKTTVEFANALRFATETANGNLRANNELVESIRPLGLSRQQSRAAVTEAARFTEDQPEDINRLTKIVTNIAAERGDGIDRTDELIEQLRRRESKFYKRIFGTTVESIYEGEAAKQVDRNAYVNPDLIIGGDKDDFKSRGERIKSYVAAMTDAQKERAVLNYIIQQGSRFEGEAERRATTLAGRLDALSAAWLDSQEGVGLFITELKPLNSLLESIGGKLGVIDGLRGPELGRDANGRIGESELRQFALDKTTGRRARIIDSIDEYGGVALAGATLLGSAGLFGRRQATDNLRQDRYTQFFTQNRANPAFGGDNAAAQADAFTRAKDLKPGPIRSVSTGLQRITLGMTEQIDRFVGQAVNTARTSGTSLNPSVRRGREEILAAQSVKEQAFLQAEQRRSERFGTAGGLLGGAVGGTIGALIATKLDAGPVTATVLTITGGIVGNFVGTTAGTVAGDGISSALKTAGAGAAGAGGYKALLAGSAGASGIALALGIPLAAITGYGVGTALERGTGDLLNTPAARERRDRLELRREEIAAGAYSEQVRERSRAVEENRLRFRKTTVGGGSDTLGLLTPQQVTQMVKDGRASLKDFVEEIIPKAEELTGILGIQRKLQEDLAANEASSFDATAKLRRKNQLEAKADADSIYGTSPERLKDIDDYRAAAAERESKRVAKEAKEREALEKKKNDALQQQQNALAKIRDAEQGSFRVVEDIARIKGRGDSNPYVKLLTDEATLTERMRQQWGFRGQAAVDYFTKLEQEANDAQKVVLAFDTFAKDRDIRNRIDRERDERGGPGFSTRQNLAGDIASNAVNVTRGLYAMRRREAEITGNGNGFYTDPLRSGKGLINDIDYSGTIAGYANGATSRQISLITGQAIEDVLSQFSTQQISNDPYLKSVALRVNRDRQTEQIYQYQDSVAKLGLQNRDDARIGEDLAKAQMLRDEQLRLGRNPRDVGQEYDRYIIGRTDNIPVKDLSYQDFERRQAAQQREAVRNVQQEGEARAATKLGLAYQASMNKELQIIREAIIGGNVQMLLQVQNDTQARLDQQALQETNPNFRVALDQGQVKSNPYGSAFNRYGRGGNK